MEPLPPWKPLQKFGFLVKDFEERLLKVLKGKLESGA